MQVSYAHPAEASAALFGRASESVSKFVKAGVEKFSSICTNDNLVGMVKDRFAEFTTGKTARRIEAIRNRLRHKWKDNSIRTLQSLKDWQSAPDEMKRFVMSAPTLRRLFHDGRSEGFEGVYVDKQPNQIGVGHHDFMFGTDGVHMKDDNSLGGIRRHYVTNMFEEERSLTAFEKISISRTIESIECHLDAVLMADNEDDDDDDEEIMDPASLWNSPLG